MHGVARPTSAIASPRSPLELKHSHLNKYPETIMRTIGYWVSGVASLEKHLKEKGIEILDFGVFCDIESEKNKQSY